MDDLISRQAAIRWIKAECNPYGKPTLDYETSCRIMEYLDRMPSAQPERKKGRWLIKGRKICCSECGRVNFCKPNFCDECGADMREEKTDG
jgi:hypothetical protein